MKAFGPLSKELLHKAQQSSCHSTRTLHEISRTFHSLLCVRLFSRRFPFAHDK